MASVIRTWGEMRTEIEAESRLATTAANRTSLLQWANEALLELAAEFDFHELNTRYSITLATAAQTNADWPNIETNAPMDIMRITYAEINDISATPDQYSPLDVISHYEFLRLTRGVVRSNTSYTALPKYIAVRRKEGVRENVANDALISVQCLSDATGDTTQTAALMSYRAVDRREVRKQSVTLTGTTAVSYTGTHIPIAFSKSADTTGIITLRQVTTNTEIAMIMPWDRSAYYNVFEFYPWPDDADVVWIEYQRRPPLMSATDDVPYGIPSEAHAYIVEYTKAKAMRLQEDADWQLAWNEAQRIKANIVRLVAKETLEDQRVILARASPFDVRGRASIFRPY